MAFAVIYTIRDSKGKRSTTEINFPSSFSFTDVSLFAAQHAERINDLIKGRIERIGVAFNVDVPAAIRANPLPGSDVEEGAKFQFRTVDGNFTSMRLPTFNEDYVVEGTRTVDLADPLVDEFVDAMVTGAPVVALGGVLHPSDKRDEDIVALEFAREQFTNSRPGSD